MFEVNKLFIIANGFLLCLCRPIIGRWALQENFYISALELGNQAACNIGYIHKQCNEKYILTFLSLFLKDNDAVRQLKKLLVDKCREFTSKEKTAEFTEVMEGPHSVGFLLNERFINIPPQIAVPVYKTLRYMNLFFFVKRPLRREEGVRFQRNCGAALLRSITTEDNLVLSTGFNLIM